MYDADNYCTCTSLVDKTATAVDNDDDVQSLLLQLFITQCVTE